MKNKLKGFLTIALIIISIFAMGTTSQAAKLYNSVDSLMNDEQNAVDGTISVGSKTGNGTIYLKGEGNKNLYCVDMYKFPTSSERSTTTYKISNYVEIVGSLATIYDSRGKIGSYRHIYNAKLANILGGENYATGYGKSTDQINVRQVALYKFWNTWSEIAKSNSNIDVKGSGNNVRPITFPNYDDAMSLIKPSDDYAGTAGSEAEISLMNDTNKTISSESTSDGKEMIGPIRLSYKGTLSNDDIKITAKDGSAISISQCEFWEKESGVYTKKLGNIPSGKTFYILNKSGKQAEKVNFKVKANNTSKGAMKAQIWILEHMNNQRLIIAKAGRENKPSEKQLEIKVQKQETANITFEKEDSRTKEKLQGAEFRIFIGKEDKLKRNNWLGIDEKTKAWTYNASYENAAKFTTGSDGKVTINNLNKNLKISIYETKAPNGYTLENQKGYNGHRDDQGKGVNIFKQIVWCNQRYYNVGTVGNVSIKIKNKMDADIEIIKVDRENSEKTLSGAEFRISANAPGDKTASTWLRQKEDGTYKYTAQWGGVTKFTTDSNGKVQIKGLEKGTYYIYEITAPTGYNLKEQDNYDKENNWVFVKKIEIKESNNEPVIIKHENILEKTKYISLEGYVWIEKPGSKANEYNDICDNGEEIITDKVKITLRNKSDNQIIAENPTIKTESGKATYRFEKIDYNKLKDYYVHFDYSEKYKKYITVSANFDIAEGSKAISDRVEEHDKDLSGNASTYKGTTNEAKYGLSGLANKFYDEHTYTLKNINLGIKELPNTPFTVSENLAYVDVKIKGYNYRYIYGGTGNVVQTVPTVAYQSKTDKQCYTREFYPSDILYENTEDKTQELQAYVTYRIDVTNNTKLDIPYLYQEQDLRVSRITNKYDTARYELADENWQITDESNVVEMKQSYLQTHYYERGFGISGENERNNKYAYITFKIKDNKIKEMLTKPEGTIEDFPTTAEVTAYHKYTRIDYSWRNNLSRTQNHSTEETTMKDSAPYLLVGMMEKSRTISGKVFEDRKDNSRPNELVGNGMYDEDENKVKGVKVELGNLSSEGKFIPTKLYQSVELDMQIVAKTDAEGNIIEAVTTTGEDGTYKFEGVIPGEYLIRYTYGDGTQEIVSTQGNKKVYSNKYKSTIVTDEVRRAFETNYEPTKATWYLGIGANHNMALDDLTIRENISEGLYEVKAGNINNNESKNMIASTRELSIPVEYKQNNEGSVTEEYPTELGYMDFGIIEMPRTRIDIKKKITNIKLVAQNGQVLLEGNPATQHIAYTTDLDKKTEGGSTYVKIEMDSNNIYGATLEIKYEIEVSNNSDLDYIETKGSSHYGNYYKYGDKANATEKKVEVQEVYDYLDPKISYKSKEGTQSVETLSFKEYRNQDEDRIPSDVKQILSLVKEVEDTNNSEFEKILKITNFGNLSSSKGANKENSRSTITINAEKLLSSQDDDLEFINIAEVIKVKTEPITPANVELPEAERTSTEIMGAKIAKTPKVTLTVTPSTGANRSIVYFIVGAIALVVVAGGIVIIRKNSKK